MYDIFLNVYDMLFIFFEPFSNSLYGEIILGFMMLVLLAILTGIPLLVLRLIFNLLEG